MEVLLFFMWEVFRNNKKEVVRQWHAEECTEGPSVFATSTLLADDVARSMAS